MALLLAAWWALGREMAGVHVRDLLNQLGRYGWPHLTLALGATAASFVVLGWIEYAAFRMTSDATRRVLRLRQLLGTSFVANALSQSVGLALLTGSAVRARAYARHGIDGATSARVTAFVTFTTALGLVTTGAVALLASDDALHVRTWVLAPRPLGTLLAAVALAYVIWSALGERAPRSRRAWRVPRPSLGIASAQLGLSALDWLLTGVVLFAFLSPLPGVGFWLLMRDYLIAQMVAVTSHVPGGAGVLELVLLALLGSAAAAPPRTAIVGALVMFRVVYYLVPLVLALIVAGLAELRSAAKIPPLAAQGVRAG